MTKRLPPSLDAVPFAVLGRNSVSACLDNWPDSVSLWPLGLLALGLNHLTVPISLYLHKALTAPA